MDSILGDVETVAEQCARNATIDFEPIRTCVNTRQGNELQHFYAVQTESIKPKNAFVPWITLNGKHTEEIQEQAQINLIRLLCQTYRVKFDTLGVFFVTCSICLGYSSTGSM